MTLRFCDRDQCVAFSKSVGVVKAKFEMLPAPAADAKRGRTVFQVGTISDGNGTISGRNAARNVPKIAVRPDFTSLLHGRFYSKDVTVETFKEEMALAMKAYDSYVINIDKIPEEFEATLKSLMVKAIRAYETRGPQLRHGIALDKHVTVILSQSDNERPLCGIYFNLHSPYQKQSLPKTMRAVEETIGETRKAKED